MDHPVQPRAAPGTSALAQGIPAPRHRCPTWARVQSLVRGMTEVPQRVNEGLSRVLQGVAWAPCCGKNFSIALPQGILLAQNGSLSCHATKLTHLRKFILQDKKSGLG